ncbi:hypothetical protein V1511DRAFT_490913 [Dipodascopsis uninucleata]
MISSRYLFRILSRKNSSNIYPIIQRFRMSTDPALELLSKSFGNLLTLNNPEAVASLEASFPKLTEEQEKKQAEVLALSEGFPEKLTELNSALGKGKFILGTSTPSVADLIIYSRVREPVVKTWSDEECVKNANLIRWADRVQKSGLIKVDDSNQLIKLDAINAAKKKEKGSKPQTSAPASKEISPAMVDLRVGFIQKAVKHPDADSLYVSTIDMGDESGPRTVCSGLVKYVPIEDMQQRYVVVVANLKPVNMRGIKSEAMLLCASDEGHGKVEFTIPPENSKPGDKLFFEGFDGTPESQLNPKKKVFETIQPMFSTNTDLDVTFTPVDGSGPRKLVNKEGKAVKATSLIGATVR